jgi:ABC-type sugar transport system substrate-binding protein
MGELHSPESADRTPGHGVSRRNLVLSVVAGVGGVALASLAACTPAAPTSSPQAPSPTSQAASSTPQAASSSSQTSNNSVLGPKRTIVWAIAAIAPWNEPVDVGFNDAAQTYGWTYNKIGVPIAQYSDASHVDTIKRAILTKPDILVTSWWVKGVKDVMAEAQQAGIFCLCNDADNFPEDRKSLGIAWIGTDGYANGRNLAQRMLQTLGSNGTKSGVIVFGNPFPGNENIEVRAKGMQAAIDAWNSANGTSFTLDNFADKSDADAPTSSGLYQAKLTQLGTNLVAAAGVATGWPSLIIDVLSSKGSKPGQIVLGAFRADPPARKGLHDGWIVASADESLYPAGYLTATLAWQYFQRSIAPRDYATGGSLIDNSNIAAIDQRESVITNLSKQYGVRLS